MKVVKYSFIYRLFLLFSHYIVVPELLGLSLLRITKDMRLC